MFVFVVVFFAVFAFYLVEVVYRMFRQNVYVKNLPRVPIKMCLPMLLPKQKSTDTYNCVNAILHKYDGLAKLWMGSQLVVTCDDPVNMKTILMSKDCLDKPNLYRMTAGGGDGLATAESNCPQCPQCPYSNGKHRKVSNFRISESSCHLWRLIVRDVHVSVF